LRTGGAFVDLILLDGRLSRFDRASAFDDRILVGARSIRFYGGGALVEGAILEGAILEKHRPISVMLR
jgi:hypothetical protein